VRVRLRTQVDTRWRTLPLLIAHLRAPRGNGDFVLMSGHVDSWHYGAMDNGAGNATQMEVGRIFAARKKRLRRDLRLAFWSGHSTPGTAAPPGTRTIAGETSTSIACST